MNSEAVWDSSALLMVLKREPGWERLAGQINTAIMSTVNLSEVAAHFVTLGRAIVEVETYVQSLALRLYPFNDDQAYRAAAFRPLTRQFGLSLGDRACLALGQHLQIPVLTADRIWSELNLGIEIELVR